MEEFLQVKLSLHTHFRLSHSAFVSPILVKLAEETVDGEEALRRNQFARYQLIFDLAIAYFVIIGRLGAT